MQSTETRDTPYTLEVETTLPSPAVSKRCERFASSLGRRRPLASKWGRISGTIGSVDRQGRLSSQSFSEIWVLGQTETSSSYPSVSVEESESVFLHRALWIAYEASRAHVIGTLRPEDWLQRISGKRLGEGSIDAVFEIRDATCVHTYLRERPFLRPVLLEIRERLSRYLSAKEVSLYVSQDPESPGDEQMIVSVLPDMEPDDAYEGLVAFEESWWLDNIHRARGDLCVMVEFR